MRECAISVLSSVYNTDFELVKRSIDSVLQQTFQDFELIVIDDGSDNGSHRQLLDYCMRFEDKITYLRHSNRGQAESINRGVRNCSGQYITILDADDEYKPSHLARCLEVMENYDLISSNADTVVGSPDDYFVPDMTNPTELVHVDDCILFATLFGRREVFEKILFQDGYAADAHFFELAARRYKVGKLNLRSYIYYRNNPNSICGKEKRRNSPSYSS
jgi:glycosyltransferase involved in cell wall biosynthesis